MTIGDGKITVRLLCDYYEITKSDNLPQQNTEWPNVRLGGVLRQY